MATKEKCSSFRTYNINELKPIERLNINDNRVNELINSMQPVVIENSGFVSSALHWDLNYLRDHLGSGKFTVYESDSHVFKYYDEKKMKKNKAFKPQSRRCDMTLTEFSEKIKDKTQSDKRYYLQQELNDGVSSRMVEDFKAFRWDWVTAHQKRNNWGPLTANLLLIGQEGNVTPSHYDEQENFFAQLQGEKRFILFPPSQFGCLYPHPVYHPHDRQSQIDFDNIDLTRFPKFDRVQGVEAVVKPGDVLYIPNYWWHHVESRLHAEPTISLTFWYKCAPPGTIEYPLKPHQKVAMMRNIEKMIAEALDNNNEVDPFMQNMILGRYTSSTH